MTNFNSLYNESIKNSTWYWKKVYFLNVKNYLWILEDINKDKNIPRQLKDFYFIIRKWCYSWLPMLNILKNAKGFLEDKKITQLYRTEYNYLIKFIKELENNNDISYENNLRQILKDWLLY